MYQQTPDGLTVTDCSGILLGNADLVCERGYGVDVFALQAGDILVSDEHEYRVTEGFSSDESSCWRQSRYVRCTDSLGFIKYVNPITALARVGGAA